MQTSIVIVKNEIDNPVFDSNPSLLRLNNLKDIHQFILQLFQIQAIQMRLLLLAFFAQFSIEFICASFIFKMLIK